MDPPPSTLNPRPSTLNPKPSTPTPKPYTSSPKPPTLNLEAPTLHPKPNTLNPIPYTRFYRTVTDLKLVPDMFHTQVRTRPTQDSQKGNVTGFSKFPNGTGSRNDIHIGRAHQNVVDTPVLTWDALLDVTFSHRT